MMQVDVTTIATNMVKYQGGHSHLWPVHYVGPQKHYSRALGLGYQKHEKSEKRVAKLPC